jgi:hypothetical protein
MKIVPVPIRTDDTLELFKAGDILTVNGEDFDFSQLGEGDSLPSSAITSTWFIGDQTRVDGDLVLTLFLPNPWNYSHEQAFPVDLVGVPDGPVLLPQPLPEAVEVTDEH